jgi:ABC-type lipoprotein release transport system permease subunit
MRMSDLPMLAAVSVAILIPALVATYHPARLAAVIDPRVAPRYE